jgi:diguanylate cyclase (GGDEF)-like protein
MTSARRDELPRNFKYLQKACNPLDQRGRDSRGINTNRLARAMALRHHADQFRLLLQPISLFGFAIIIIFWTGVAYELSIEHSAVQDFAIARGAGWARMVADATFQLIHGIDRSLLILRQDYEENPERFDLNQQATRIAAINNVTTEVGLIGSDGLLKARTGYSGPPIDLSDREHFKAQVEDPVDELFISKPILLRTTGKPQIQMTRRLRNHDGSFDGVLTASLDPSFIERFQRTLGFGEKSIVTVRGMDGYVRATFGLSPDAEKVSKELLSAAAQSPEGHRWSEGRHDGVYRLVSFRTIPEYSLIIIVAEPAEHIFADYIRDRKIYLSVAALFTLLVLFVIAFITRHQLALAQASASAARLSHERDIAIDSMAQGLCMFDAQGRLIVCNKKYAELYGLDQELTKPGTIVRAIFEYRVANNSAPEPYQNRVTEWIDDATTSQPFEAVQTLVDGRHIAVTHRPTAEGGWVATHEDITDQRMSQARVEHLARHDQLTDLGNRAALMDRMEEECARCRQWGETFSLLFLDLDRFKQVNDTLGHPAGDALLRAVAARLKGCLRETDAIARLGGDEFAIIQAHEIDQLNASSELAERIISELCKPFTVDDNEVYIGVSVGIALGLEHATNPDELMKMSDMALYQAKEAGRNCYRVFDVAMTDAMVRRHELENDLRHALESGQLRLHYQPIVEATTRRMCGAEALIRWQHPTKGIISPDRFIPLAEESGLIFKIGQWVLHTACAEAADWPANIKLAVNLSAKQFSDPGLLDVVMYILTETGLPPERLELEITETALIESAASILPLLRQFKNLGIAIALDDFGTGYSSLSQLTMFPFDKIKIDKSFTQKITSRADCAAIISATVTLAQNLGKETTAEGIETAEQYKLLRLVGVTTLQGYLFKRPGPASELDFTGIHGDLGMEHAA